MSESKKSAEQVEQERLTRRQALRKLGFGAGLSAILLLGADDLARMVGTKMRQMEGDSKVADQIAREFQSAGVAFATGPSGPCSKTDLCSQVQCTFEKCIAKCGAGDEGCRADCLLPCGSAVIANNCQAGICN